MQMDAFPSDPSLLCHAVPVPLNPFQATCEARFRYAEGLTWRTKASFQDVTMPRSSIGPVFGHHTADGT